MILLFFVIFCIPALARAEYKSETSLQSVFRDEVPNSPEVLVFEAGHKARVLDINSWKVLRSFENHCPIKAESSPNTAWEIKSYSYPYFVSLTQGCFFNEKTGVLEPLNDNTVGENSFFITYLGKTSEQTFFLFNARPWDQDGTIYLKIVDQQTNAIEVKPLIQTVPDFSGAMRLSADGKTFFYTVASGNLSNQLYSVKTDELLSLISSGKSATFTSMAQLVYEFPGLSMSLETGDDYLYYGDYFVELKTGKQLKRSSSLKNCSLPFLYQGQAAAFCGSNTLNLVPIESWIQR